MVGAASGVILLGLIQNILDLVNAPNYWIDAINGAVISSRWSSPGSSAARPRPNDPVRPKGDAAAMSKILGFDTHDVRFPTSLRLDGSDAIANLLLAAKFGVPVCPHAGGVGLCEIVQHLSMYDYAALSGTMQGRMIEWIDHLHEHFVTPAVVSGGRYLAPETAGASTRIQAQSLAEYSFPTGAAWRTTLMT